MTLICEDLIICIRNIYINPLWLKLCNKKYYTEYIEKECIIEDSKIRRLIRKDSQYILDLVLKNNIDKFIKRKKYIYRTNVYKNYIDFMIYYCINNESPKCINVIKNKYGNYTIKSK